MKTLFKQIALVFCLGAVMSSCTKKIDPVIPDAVPIFPVADFTATRDPLDGFTYKFTNTSKNYDRIELRFGDDTLKTDANVSHTYLTVGDPAKAYKYTVDLKAISKTGDISHKYLDIKLSPDSVVQFTTQKIASTSSTATLKFIANLKATAKSYLWTFTDNRKATPITTTSTSASPQGDYFVGSFNSFTCTIVTDKGSTVTGGATFTVDGIATNITQSYTNDTPLYPAAITNVENTDQGAREGASKLVDGNLTTKFGYYKPFPTNLIITLVFPAPVKVTTYSIMNGNDSGSSRDPKEWSLQGGNDPAGPWTEIDHRLLTKGFYDMGTDLQIADPSLVGTKGPSGLDFRYRKWWYYPVATPGIYSIYRWQVLTTFSGAFQMTEFALYK